MTSEDLYRLADRVSLGATSGKGIDPALCRSLALELFKHGTIVSAMEMMPIAPDLVIAMLDAVPEYTIARAAHAPQRTAP